MTLVGWAQIALVLILVLGCSIPLSKFVAGVFAGERNFLTPAFGPVERGFYRLAGVDPAHEQDWFTYTIAMVIFSIAGFVSLYALQRLQNFLPLNPRGFDAVPPDLAFNTSASFITNTNWQNYGGETTMSSSHPDARPHRAQLPVGGDGSRDGLRAGAGIYALLRDDCRQFLGRCDAHHALHSPADLVRLCVCVCGAGHAADARRRR